MHVLPREAADVSAGDERCLLHASPLLIQENRLAPEIPEVHLGCGEFRGRLLFISSLR